MAFMIHRNKSLMNWVIYLILLLGVFNFIHQSNANELNSTNQPSSHDDTMTTNNNVEERKDNNHDNNLDFAHMTNEELEAICTSRGFELVRELDENGKEKEFTREDYIDGAKQCLDIESEMERILQEHPHLLDEIEAEAEKMRKEKENLEDQLSKVQNELEQEKVKGGEKFIDAFMDDNDDDKDIDSHQGEEPVYDSNASGEQTNSGILFGNEDDNGQDAAESDSVNNTENEEVLDLDNCCDTTDGNEGKPSDETEATSSYPTYQETDNESVNSKLTLGDNNDTNVSIVTLKDIAMEFRDQVKRDFSRVYDIVLPVQYREPLMNALRPVFIVVKNSVNETYTMVKRYTSIILQEMIKPSTESKNDNVTSQGLVAEDKVNR